MTMLAEQKNEKGLMTLADYEARIHLYKEQIGSGFIGIGRTLIEAKAAKVVPHGAWETWVTQTTGLNIQQAQRCMRAAREIKDGSALARLEMSKALLLLSSGLEESDRESLAEKAAAESATVQQLREEIKRMRGDLEAANEQSGRAIMARDQAMREAKKAEEDAETYRGSAIHWKEAAEYRAKRIEELREAAPRTVIREPEDYAKLKAQADRHEAEMEEAAQAAAEAEARAAAAEAELNRLRRAQGEKRRDRYAEISDAANSFLIAAQMLPYDRAELSTPENRMRYELLMKPIRAWVLDMQRALEFGPMDAEGAVV